MFEKLETTRMAQALAAHSGVRLGLVAQNVAHADTPGYKARDLPDFAAAYADWTNPRSHRPILQNGAADPNGNSVNLQDQMVLMAQIRQDHDLALTIQRNVSAIVRAAMGRSGA